jgi:hypothetical protein
MLIAIFENAYKIEREGTNQHITKYFYTSYSMIILWLIKEKL